MLFDVVYFQGFSIPLPRGRIEPSNGHLSVRLADSRCTGSMHRREALVKKAINLICYRVMGYFELSR